MKKNFIGFFILVLVFLTFGWASDPELQDERLHSAVGSPSFSLENAKAIESRLQSKEDIQTDELRSFFMYLLDNSQENGMTEESIAAFFCVDESCVTKLVSNGRYPARFVHNLYYHYKQGGQPLTEMDFRPFYKKPFTEALTSLFGLSSRKGHRVYEPLEMTKKKAE